MYFKNDEKMGLKFKNIKVKSERGWRAAVTRSATKIHFSRILQHEAHMHGVSRGGGGGSNTPLWPPGFIFFMLLACQRGFIGIWSR